MKHVTSLCNFLSLATEELVWLNEKEQREVERDWSARELNVSNVQDYYRVRCRYMMFALLVIAH